MNRLSRVAIGLWLLTMTASAAEPVPPDHAAKMRASTTMFQTHVRAILTEHCLKCHGGEKVKGGFSLATRDLLLQGGDRGKAVIPGKPKESFLMKLVHRTDEPHMPPKAPLPAEAVKRLDDWIESGAAYDKPLVEGAGGKKPMTVTDKDRDYWAYRSLQPKAVPTPKTAGPAVSPIDAFIQAKLDAAGIPLAAELGREKLLRRVTFDLIGLPPTTEELDAFLADSSPRALETVVDRLLASPRYGERWARHWLDPARYAESHGFEHDYYRPHAYHYRDFVIRAMNADMPFDQFVRWQVAGDELAPENPEALAATGFLGAGVFPTQITNREAERIRYDAMDDMLATTGSAVLGLTVGCARCHDHKYDPIPTRDYYRMLSAFTGTVRSEIDVDLGTPAERKATADFEAKRKPLADALETYTKTDLPKAFAGWLADQRMKKDAWPTSADATAAKGLKALGDGKTAFEKLPAPQRDAVLKWFAPQDAGWKDRQAKLAELDKTRPPDTRVKMQVTTDGRKAMRHHTADGSIPDVYPTTHILNRGDVDQKGDIATFGVLAVLNRSGSDGTWTKPKPPTATTPFTRVSLAEWLTDTRTGAGALAARVIVNRLWHHHFGRGIVATVNDFGFQSDPPTHPDLLEWLADDLIANGWTLKRLHKQIVLSRVYRSASTPTPEGQKLDPENKLWHYRPRRRLEAEAVRDAGLAVSGLLDVRMFGPGETDEGMKRRSIYFRVKRADMIPMLQVFDWPDTLTSAGVRPTTVVPPQALMFLNSPHVRQWATTFADRLKPTTPPDEFVTRAYRAAFGRTPTAAEKALGVKFLASGRAPAAYTHALLGLNEFIYID